MEFNGPKVISNLLDKIESTVFEKDVFDKMGVYVIRNGIAPAVIKEWKDEWDRFYAKLLGNGRDVDVVNPVNLKESLPDALKYIYRNDSILDIAEKVFGKDIALFGSGFAIKDRFSPGPVFLHQDYGYHFGNPVKASFFIPLTLAGEKSGGLTFYPGTHKYGALGDAGEINPDQFDEIWPKYTPELMPGDIAIMNSLVWHESGPNTTGIDRIIANIIYQPTDDPSGKELLRGEWQTDIFFKRNITVAELFKRARTSKSM